MGFRYRRLSRFKMIKIPYTLRRRPWSRVLRFAIKTDGRLIVTAPVLIGKRMIEKMIEEKREWIIEKIDAICRDDALRRLDSNYSKPDRTTKQIAEDKKNALRLINDRIAHFNLHYRLTWNRIAIRNQQSRWGSCSSKKNLNFHYKIALLPPHLADYLIVHELCHLAQMNHSKDFWDLVAQTVPDWKDRRKAMKAEEIRLR